MKRKSKLSLVLGVALVLAAALASVPSGIAQACYDYKAYDLEFTVVGGAVYLTWSPPESYGDLTLLGYNVYRWDKDASTQKLLTATPVKACSFTDATVEVDHTYVYWVKCFFREEGESAESNKVEVDLAALMPAPSGLEAFPIEGAIRLEWYPADTGGTEWGLVGYIIYRSEAADGWEPEQLTDPLTGCGFNDFTARPSVIYGYFAVAFYANGQESPPTNQVTMSLEGQGDGGGGGTPPPGDGDGEEPGDDDGALTGSPRSLTADLADGAVILRWQAPATGIEDLVGYYVYRKDSQYAFNGDPLIDFAIDSLNWIDNTIQPDLTYTYWVTAVDKNGKESAASNMVEIGLSGKQVVLTINQLTARVGGETVTLDQPPIIIDGRTMLPFRFVAENMGATVEWNQETQQVICTYGETVVVLAIGSQVALVNGQPMPVNVPAQIVNERTMVPLRFLANAFGWDLQWDNVTRTVTVTVGTGA